MIEEIKKEEMKDPFLFKIKEDMENNPFGKALILKEKEEIIGYLYYSDIYERIEINQFEIKEEFQHQGKGNFLLQEFLKRVQKDITLEVREDNIPAIRVYEKNGFQKKAIRKGYYEGTDGILMERKAL